VITFVTFQGAILALLLGMIAYCDLRSFRIPDALNNALAFVGLAFSMINGSEAVREGLLAAALGGGLIWLARFAFKRFRRVDGLGLGDVKFITAAGLWLTPHLMPWMILSASLTGIAHHLLSGADRTQRLPFGPHLALGLFFSWLLKILGLV
jgi:leader peptidase (prepilin peptidase) / N-methyltransferase